MRFERNFLLDHTAEAGRIHFVRIDSLGEIKDSLPPVATHEIPTWMGGLPIRPGSAMAEAVGPFLPRVDWAFGNSGTIWHAPSDELRLVHRALSGDTIRIVETVHRPGSFTRAEAELIDGAEAEVARSIPFVPQVIEGLHVMQDGYVLAQIAGELNAPGSTFDVFDPEGRYLGPLDSRLAVHPYSVAAIVGDTLLAITLGELDVPFLVRLTIHR